MPLHYLDPEREPRECPERWHKGVPLLPPHRHPKACRCHGTGHLGEEDAERVEVKYREHRSLGWDNHGHYWRTDRRPPDAGWHGPFDTRDAALEAARKAHREKASG